jgi:lipoprotein NlpD
MLERMPLLLLMLVVLLAGCASSKNRAPVEERAASPRPSAASGSEAAAIPAAPTAEVKPLPNAEHAGKPGYYTVKPGDTLIRIGLENGQNWRDVARWNGIENPNLIEVGQVLRVVAPSVDPNAVAARGVTPTKVEPRPLDAKPPAAAASATAAGTPAAAASAAPAAVAAPAKDPDDDLGWLWPANGPVASGFEEGRSKGVAITGKAGDPVLAAADGRVVYAGSGLRGYGNLVIVKHNNTYLTAYAHNQTLLVKEDQVVRRGQRIAEMGSSDADRVQLHFEIRKQGKPVDPQRLLPPR